MGKTTFALMLCPVLACGTGEDAGRASPSPGVQQPVYASEGPLFTAVPVTSRREAVLFRGTEQLIADSVTASGPVKTGDTLARLVDPLGTFAESRIAMDMARAQALGLTETADSLEAILASPPWVTWALSPLEGRLLWVRTGTLLSPGDTLALVSTPAECLWVLHSPIPIELWPPVPGLTLLESSKDTALVRGEWSEGGFSLPGGWIVPGQTLREDGLLIFVLSAGGDSIPVQVLGDTPEGTLVHCRRSLHSVPLLRWAARRE